ncbi:unnamed protein product, partial [Prorocentrum cordatum]
MAQPVETLFDELIASNSSSAYETHQRADITPASEDGIDISSIKVFLDTLPRDNRYKNQKTWKVVVDYMSEWVAPEGFSLEALGDAAKGGVQAAPPDSVPSGVLPGQPLAEADTVQLVMERNEDGTYEVLKIFNLKEPVSAAHAHGLCVGDALRVPKRANAYGARKAFQTILQRARGWRLLFAKTVDEDAGANHGKRKSPHRGEITRGIEFIKVHSPPMGTMAQVEWLLINNKAKDPPIRGWPAAYVNKICEIKAKSKMTAELEQDFPLTASDLKDSVFRDVVSAIAPYLPDHGLLAVGRPGAGKTPFAFIMAPGLGQYWLDQAGVEGVTPGWYRGKQFDDFKGVDSLVHNGVVIDDGNVPKFRCDDVKQFMDAGFKRHVDCRYSPASFAKNCFRAICDNTWDSAAEPSNPQHGVFIKWGTFYAMIRPSFSDGANMWAYGDWKRGVRNYPDGFKQAKAAERELFANLLRERPRGDAGASSVRRAPEAAWQPWDGSLPANSDGAPGWWALLAPEKKSELARFAHQAIQHYRGLLPDVFEDMRREFGVSCDAASDVVHYFLAGVAESEEISRAVEAGLAEVLGGGAVAEGMGEEQVIAALADEEEALKEMEAGLAAKELEGQRDAEAEWDAAQQDANGFLGFDDPPAEKGIQYYARALPRHEKNAHLIAEEQTAVLPRQEQGAELAAEEQAAEEAGSASP